MRVPKDTEDAADATQEVFLRAFGSLTAMTETERARAWLITVARHHCLDLLRRRKRLGKALITLAADPIRQGEVERAVVDRNFVQAVFGQLGERERQALWQSAVADRPIGEIGRYLGLSYVAAAQLLHRARRHASLVAAKLAAIFGLLQLSRLGKRPAFSVEVQPLAVAMVVPLVVAGFVGASPPQQGSARPFAGPSGIAVRSPAWVAASASSSTAAVSTGEASGRLGLALPIRPSAVHQVQSTLNAFLPGALPAPGQLITTRVPVSTPTGRVAHRASIKSS